MLPGDTSTSSPEWECQRFSGYIRTLQWGGTRSAPPGPHAVQQGDGGLLGVRLWQAAQPHRQHVQAGPISRYLWKCTNVSILEDKCDKRWSLLTACKSDSQSDMVSSNITMLEDNLRLRDLTTLLQGKHHKMSMEVWWNESYFSGINLRSSSFSVSWEWNWFPFSCSTMS